MLTLYIISDECSSNPCLYGGQCIDEINDYTCNCTAGYEGDQCEIRPAICDDDPCESQGECLDDYRTNTFRCVCGGKYSACKLPFAEDL